ncbi:16S rRNA (guanine(527)-N(7))-methyltransferase RsmG [bacterium]|nr:16S rRNA (guanine(527)-N(7))-methyltransferase RsmG [bacterium]
MTFSPSIQLEQALMIHSFELLDAQKGNILLFLEICLEWNSKINLTAHNNYTSLIQKDVLDTLFLNLYIKMYIQKFKKCMDMGCGAGFVGIILAILHPEKKFYLVDANHKKINFVRYASNILKLNNIYPAHQRVDSPNPLMKEGFDLLVSRATWRIKDYIDHALNYVQNNAHILYMAGTHKNNDEPDLQEYQGLEKNSDYFYKILPENIEHKIISYTAKVSRETIITN